MRRPLTTLVMLVFVAALAGCGVSPRQDAGADSRGSSTPTANSGAIPDRSPYDVGPRAAETGPANAAEAAEGAKLFTTKGCSACHAFGKRLTCPDLAGVTQRRTTEWMEHQILHPEVMTKSDPISHGLFATFALQMPNQHLTEAEAKAVIEYFKTQDAGGATGSKEGKR